MQEQKPWLKQYPTGVSPHLPESPYGSVPELMEDSFAKYGDRTAYLGMGTALSFGELGQQSAVLAAWLQGQGLQRGDRVALMMPNILAYPVATAAVLRAGMVVVNVNPLYTPRELEHQLVDSGGLAIVILENFASTLQAVIHKTALKRVVVVSLGDLQPAPKRQLVNFAARHIRKLVPPWRLPDVVSFPDALKAGASMPFTRPELAPTDLAVLQYTGGTTGVSYAPNTSWCRALVRERSSSARGYARAWRRCPAP